MKPTNAPNIPVDIYENPPTRWDTMYKSEAHGSYLKIENVEYNNGIFIHVIGGEFPKKGLPSFEALWSTNLVKRILIESVKIISNVRFIPFVFLCLILPKKKFLNKLVASFNRLAGGAMNPFILKENYQMPFTQESKVILQKFMEELGVDKQAEDFAKICTHVIEYDAAYRYRLEDILSESNEKTLIDKPIREIRRLLRLLIARDINITVIRSFTKTVNILTLLLLLPSVRKAFRTSLKDCNFKKLQYDEADKYWCLIREDFNYMGLTLEQRKPILERMGYKTPTVFMHDNIVV